MGRFDAAPKSRLGGASRRLANANLTHLALLAWASALDGVQGLRPGSPPTLEANSPPLVARPPPSLRSGVGQGGDEQAE